MEASTAAKGSTIEPSGVTTEPHEALITTAADSSPAVLPDPVTPSAPLPEPDQIPIFADSTFDHSSAAGPSIHVYAPPPASASASAAGPSGLGTGPEELDESFFEPTLSDVQAHHASVLARSKRLNEAPLLTSKYRDEEREEREKRKAIKWPSTTIRVRFSDGTIIQNTFPSTSPIQPVYAFVRSALDSSVSGKPFVLWQPPRTQYPERPVQSKKPLNPYRSNIVPPANYGPVHGSTVQGLQGGTGGNETLNELGLVPQSVLLVKWDEEDMNVSTYPAPILDELKAKSEPLPEAKPKEANQPPKKAPQAPSAGQGSGEKKIPKWLQKGLMKRK